MWKQRFILIGWCTLGAATAVLLVAAMQEKEHKTCTAVNIDINGLQKHFFVDENEVTDVLKSNGAQTGKDISLFDLKKTESELEENKWIKHAQLFFDNNQVLQVKIDEREPLARVFTLNGNSFYIDSSGLRLPLSDQQTARVPVFTSFTSDKDILSAPDSAVLNDVKNIAQFIQQDSFWTAMISQINITPQRTYQMVPVIGDQVIELGNADSLQSKFDRLYSFYKQVWTKTGFEKYEKIDVQFDGQVVATIRGAAKPATDTTKAMQLLNNSAAKLNSVMKDTTYAMPVTMVHDTVSAGNTKTKPVINNSSKKKTTTNTQPIKHNMNAGNKTKPKAVMQKKN